MLPCSHLCLCAPLFPPSVSSFSPFTIIPLCCRDEYDSLPGGTVFHCSQFRVCTRVLIAWAVGGKPFDMPAQAGLPFDNNVNNLLVIQVF